MRPQVLGQALVGRIRLGREDQVVELVLQANAASSGLGCSVDSRSVAHDIDIP